MVNRLKPYLGERDEPEPASDYYEIHTSCDTYYVTREVADCVLRLLQRRWAPRWIGFTDLSGARTRIRARLIQSVRECSVRQREATRQFNRARRVEDKADRRPWEEDDWW